MPDSSSLKNYALERRGSLLGLRWLIFLWLLTDGAYRLQHDLLLAPRLGALLGVFLISQIILWRLNEKHFQGLKISQLLFLLDINLVVLALWFMGQFKVDLLVAIFLTIFMAALVQRLKPTLLIGAVGAGVLVGWRLYTPEGFLYVEPTQLLELPLIIVMGMHAAVLVDQSQGAIKAQRSLEMDKKFLKGNLGKAQKELQMMQSRSDFLFDVLPIGLVMVDTSGMILMVNHYAELSLGQTRQYLLGNLMEEIPALSEIKKLLEQGRTARVDNIVELRDETNEVMLFRVEAFPLKTPGEGLLGSLAMILPVTTRYMAEAQQAQAQLDFKKRPSEKNLEKIQETSQEK